MNLRVWANQPSAGATSLLYNAGLWLQPLDGAAGILTRGLAYPSIGLATGAQETMGAVVRTDVGVYNEGGDLRPYYVGAVPYAGASLLSTSARKLDLLAFQRQAAGASAAVPVVSGTRAYGKVQIRYQPRFSFQRFL
jgi:hypothetical protein